MAITFDCSACELPKPESDQEVLRREHLVLRLSRVGIAEVSDATEADFMKRVSVLGLLGGKPLSDESLGDALRAFRRWHGMTTNIRPRQWAVVLSESIESVVSDAESEAEYLIKKLNKEDEVAA